MEFGLLGENLGCLGVFFCAWSAFLTGALAAFFWCLLGRFGRINNNSCDFVDVAAVEARLFRLFCSAFVQKSGRSRSYDHRRNRLEETHEHTHRARYNGEH